MQTKTKEKTKEKTKVVTGTVVVDKQISVIKSNVSKAVVAAENLNVASADDLVAATELLTKINLSGDMIKSEKEKITKPQNEAIKAIRELFKPLEENQTAAKKIVMEKMITYETKVRAENLKKQAALADRVEKGTMKMSTAAKKLEEIPQASKSVKTEGAGSVSFKTVLVPEIIDTKKIPFEYMIPDMQRIAAVIKAGGSIPGVKAVERMDLSNRRN